MSTILRILRYTGRYRGMAVLAFVLAVSGTLLVLVLPGVTHEFIDEVIPGGQKDRILPLALLGVGAIALRQASFLGMPISLEELRRGATAFAPTRGTNGALAAFVLEAMDGATSLRDLEERAVAAFPMRSFRSHKLSGIPSTCVNVRLR